MRKYEVMFAVQPRIDEEFDRLAKISDDIIRHMVVRLEK